MNKQELKKGINEILKYVTKQPYYYVSYDGNVLFENESIWECKLFYKRYVNLYVNEFINKEKDLYLLTINMYGIAIDEYDLEERSKK